MSNRKQVKVAVTGGAGNIGYALLFRIASGQMFGPETDVHLNLLELDRALPALEGVKMELEDCAFPNLAGMTLTSDANVAFKDADWALLVGSVPRGKGMERGDLIKINANVFTAQGQALNDNAKSTCKVLVVGNPCNTNALIAESKCSNIPAENFFAMTMLDQNRGFAQLAQKAGVHASAVSNLSIWGNHSATQYPNFWEATIDGKRVTEVIDEAWLKDTFITTVQKRGAAIINARGASSAASAANAVVDTVKNIIAPTPAGKYFSTAVKSRGEYGVPEGLFFSYPVTSDGEKLSIVEGIELNDFSKEKIQVTTDELLKERSIIEDLLG